ncbi:tyrosine-protein kinase Mer-like isoform X2 [Asterias rubens]|uniref:tyrosine-protein kinase Mer-like isoform X2 n=1 Tax=Asterias rubens TaxID=7604 RepID=UPI001455AC93|nr:tyrosine-protein kinase Mer-like isoform X2 [Asterias rubens]
MAAPDHSAYVFFVLSISIIVMAVGELVVTSDPWVDIHQSTTITCFVVMAQALDLNWQKGPLGGTGDATRAIVLYHTTSSDRVIWNSTVDRTHFIFDETRDDFPLTIISVTLEDEGRYWCKVTDDVTFSLSSKHTDTRIRVPPTTMTITYQGNSYSNGDSIPVLAADSQQFTCIVPGIKPAANFTWMLEGAELMQTRSQVDNENQGDSRLVDSADTEAVSIAESPGTLALSCGATNRQDGLSDVEMTVTVTLQVKVPPRASSITLSDSTGSLDPDTTITVEQGVTYTLTCVVRGTRPSVTIKWYIRDQLQKTDGPDSPPIGDELVDTTSDWSFIPTRPYHDGMVKCSASTAETPAGQSAPSVSITLKVNGPPDNARITAETSPMTENEPVDLTCTADNGYPNDWSLAWFNGDIPLTNPGTAPSPQDTRFTFSSTLTFTPGRRDNGGSIICKAVRGAVTAAEGTFGPLDVRFCARSTRIEQCPMKVQQGSELALICSSESSSPATSLSWFKNKVEASDQVTSVVRDGDFNGLVTEQTYLQQFTSKVDNGAMLTCCVAGPCDDRDLCSAPCTLNVEYPPEFLRQTTPDVVVDEGQDVTLSCAADANPKPPDFITWERVGYSQPLSSVYADGVSNVTLTGLTRDQAGRYRCIGNNGIPPVVPSSGVVVRVHYQVFFRDEDDLTVGAKDGATALLKCTAMGNPLPVTQWRSATEEITNQTQPGKLTVTHTTISGDDVEGYRVVSTLEIAGVVGASDYGVYTCQSGNGIGRVVTLAIELNDRVKPQPPTGVTIDRGQIKATSVKITWTPGNDGGETQWFHVNHRKVATSVEFDPDKRSKRIDGAFEYLLERLSPFSLYEIEVYAVNVNGVSRSVKRNVTTLPLNPAEMGIAVTFRQATGAMSLEKIPENNDGCLQLEFRLNGQEEWYSYGGCQETDRELMLGEVRSRFCQGSLCSEPSQADVDASRGDVGLIAGIIILILVLLVVVVVLLVVTFHRRRFNGMDKQSLVTKKKRKPEMEYQELDIPMQIVSVPPVAKRPEPVPPTYDEVPEVDIAMAVPRDRVNIMKPLGEGAFGRVLLGRVRSIIRRGVVTDVAIKTLKDGAGPTQKDDLLRELDLMKSLPTHNNVVKLLGFCIETEPIYIIVEFLSKGNLKDLLTESRGKGKAKLQVYGNLHGSSKNLTSRDLIAMGRDVADGMAFLSEQECIHRDLAARNILVSKDMVCKVADFGLARDVKNDRVYHRKSETPLPIRWMALESIFDDLYTTKSDIWSFGILLWEIVTLGARPYPSMSAKTVVNDIEIGYRMPRPEHCQDELYQMMLNCWSDDPDDRLPFNKLSTKLGKLLETASDYICLSDYQETLYEVTMPSTSDEKI